MFAPPAPAGYDPVMPRRPRVSAGGIAFHVLNRAAGRARIFARDGDYLAFEAALAQAHARLPVSVLTYCLMPNHFHAVLLPRGDGDLSEFMRLLTVTHTQRWHAAHHTAGTGPLYQGRFKSFPVQRDDHLLTVLRYVERNPVRAGLCGRSRDWRWGGAGARAAGVELGWLADPSRWPVEAPRDWAAWVDRPQTAAEEAALAECVRRGRPFGAERWAKATARKLGLESTLRPRGRPRVRPVDVKNKDSRPL